jgi:hypothetical protein
MPQPINPADYNLSGRTVLERVGTKHIAIVIHRKSRIIMADGKKVIEKADRIREKAAKTKISLRTSAPVCGKTLRFLKEHDINVI